MRYSCVIFDMDGTVLDTLEDLTNAVNFSLAHFGMPVRSAAQVRRFLGNGARRLMEQAAPEGIEAELFESLLLWYKEYYDKNCLVKTAPYKGIPELLKELRRNGCKTALVSNKPDTAARELAEKCFGGLLDYAVGQRDDVPRKPAPDMVRLCMDKLGASAKDCVYVGDSEVDVLTAKNSGIECVAVTWGFRDEDELLAAGAVSLAHSVDELAKLLT